MHLLIRKNMLVAALINIYNILTCMLNPDSPVLVFTFRSFKTLSDDIPVIGEPTTVDLHQI